MFDSYQCNTTNSLLLGDEQARKEVYTMVIGLFGY